MSNSAAQHHYNQQDRQINENRRYLTAIAESINATPASGSDFEARQWMETNREKILRLRRLIDLVK